MKKYFLKEGKQIKLEIRYYVNNDNENELVNYWTNLIKNDKAIRIKTYIQHTNKPLEHNNSNKFGLVAAIIYDVYAKQKLNAYMDYLKEEWTQEFEQTFNTKVDRSITEVTAEPVEIVQIKRTKKSVSYPDMPILKQMLAEKGYSGVARELGCNLEAVRKHIFRNDTEPRLEKKKIVYPDIHVLITMVAEKGFVQVGKELGCSDNAIRKHLKKNRIDIKSISIDTEVPILYATN
jgi:biotin operon repressor